MSRVKRFARNTVGRDFVVGDVHGCFEQLAAALAKVGFDEEADRLFSVGDLVDRGPDSEAAVSWIEKPWFHAVRGNHEQMAIGVAAGKHDHGLYLVNGGGWFLALSDERQREIADVLDGLPICIEVETSAGLVGLVHADIGGGDWREFVKQIEWPRSNGHLRDLMEEALWSRDRIRVGIADGVTGVSKMYVGHTPVAEPVTLGNVHYIDTGCVFGRSLTLVQIDGPEALAEAA